MNISKLAESKEHGMKHKAHSAPKPAVMGHVKEMMAHHKSMAAEHHKAYKKLATMHKGKAC